MERTTIPSIPLPSLVSDYFFALVLKLPGPNGCWIWTGPTLPFGYGEASFPGLKERRAHRLSWRLHCGDIPHGLFVLHHCDVPPCTRPDHLYLGTAADNARDMVLRGRSCRGSKRSRRLIEADVAEMRRMYASGSVTMAAIANRYGIAVPTAHQIIRGDRWKHVAAAFTGRGHGVVSGESHHNSTLTDAAVADLRRAYREGEGTQATLAVRWGLHPTTVSRIVRGVSRGAVATGGHRPPGAKLTEDAVRKMRADYATGETTMRALSCTYGVSLAVVHGIVARTRWRHVR